MQKIIIAIIGFFLQVLPSLASDSTSYGPPTVTARVLCPRVYMNSTLLNQVEQGIPAELAGCHDVMAGPTKVGMGTAFGVIFMAIYDANSDAVCRTGEIVSRVRYDVSATTTPDYKGRITVTCCTMPLSSYVVYQWSTITAYTDPNTGTNVFQCN